MHQQNIRDMYAAVENDTGFDAIIIVSSSPEQKAFWQQRLNDSRGAVIGGHTRVISLEEDWPGGAGQLLGTLYAWQKAQEYEDVRAILEAGGTVAMYHTAGKGTRMAPLPASEANNKSAIKLPRMIETGTGRCILTVLEAVIFQTGIFARSRKGRLCVFWGDQVFIPSRSVDFENKYHAEILDMRGEIPSDADTWARQWQSYGLIIPKEDGALQREKQSWESVQNLISSGTIKPDERGKLILGKSLGCFTISHQLLGALVAESSTELEEKYRKLDTDPHLWMPLTSDRDEFIASGGDIENWKRVHKFASRFSRHDDQPLSLFGDKDLGNETLWWDYGQVRLYHENCLKALEDSFEGDCLRQFYNLQDCRVAHHDSHELQVHNSILLDSHGTGMVRNSLLIGGRSDNVDLDHCVCINSVVRDAAGTEALAYNCMHLANETLTDRTVVADVFLPPEGRIRMKTTLDRDGKADWDTAIAGNPYSYAELAKRVEKSR